MKDLSRRRFLVGSFSAAVGALLASQLPPALIAPDPRTLFGSFICPKCGHGMIEPCVEKVINPNDFGIITRGLISCPQCMNGFYWAFAGDAIPKKHKAMMREHLQIQMRLISKDQSYERHKRLLT